MEFPKELNLLLRNFHQDFFRFDSPDEEIIWALAAIGRKNREAVKIYLDRILAGPLDPDALQRAWRNSPAEISLKDAAQIPDMLRFIRARIDDPRLSDAP